MRRDPRFNGRHRILANRKRKAQADSRFAAALDAESRFHHRNETKVDKTGKKLEQTEVEKLSDFYGIDRARGEVNFESSSSSEEETIDFEEDGKWDAVTDRFLEETKKAQTQTEDSSKRLAFVNMDWTKVTARDVYILASSFKLVGSRILSSKVYMSEAGKKAQKEGPKTVPVESTEEFDREYLREYELSKLRWKYAVVEFDSIESAEKVYTDCDGQEYMSSSQLVDCSFIPEDMEFDEKDLVDQYSENQTNTTEEYHPINMTHSTCSHTAVASTFDLEDVRRKDMFGKAFEADGASDEEWAMCQDLIASASSDSEDDETKAQKRSLFKSLLADLDQKQAEENVHKEVTFTLDSDDAQEEPHSIDDTSQKSQIPAENPSESESMQGSSDSEPLSENEQARLEMLTNQQQNSESEDEKVREDFKIDADDSRFGALYTSSKFNIDPSAKSFKATDEMQKLATEQGSQRMKKRKEHEEKLAKSGKKAKQIESSDDETLQLIARLKKKSKK